MKKIAIFFNRLNQMNMEYALMFVMGLMATVASFNVAAIAHSHIHVMIGLLLFTTGIVTIITAAIPLPRLKYIVHLLSVTSMVYGVVKFNSMTTQFILAKTFLITFIILYMLRVIIVAMGHKNDRIN